MRGGLDETLARMARREEALRRATDPGEETGADVPVGDPLRGVEPDGWGRSGAGRPAAGDRDPVAEVAEAVRRVVADHPNLAVVVRVEHEGRTYPLRVDWADRDVTVGPDNPSTPPPAWPLSDRTVPAWSPGQEGPTGDPAARLAEMIRRDPSLLDDDR